jgi:hypothetical protein
MDSKRELELQFCKEYMKEYMKGLKIPPKNTKKYDDFWMGVYESFSIHFEKTLKEAANQIIREEINNKSPTDQ